MLYLLAFFVLLLIACNIIISCSSRKYIYEDIARIPYNKTGLLLGTSKYLKTGEHNLFYRYRLKAAYDLYKNGKINFIIASGDNRLKSYNEPQKMKEDLIKKGIPASLIYPDYAGFRTLDSVIRSKKIFGQKRITIISQKFHIERAIFIARHFDIEAIGFCAGDVRKSQSLKTIIREYFAKLKALIDLYITKKQPKYLGKKIIIE